MQLDLLAVIASTFLVIHPNNTREIRDTKPRPDQVPANSQILEYSPDPTKDVFCFEDNGNNVAVYVPPPEVAVVLPPNPANFLRILAEDPDVTADTFSRANKIAHILDLATQQKVYDNFVLTDTQKQKLVEAAHAAHIDLKE